MGLGVSGCILDTPSEIHSWVGQQTRNHILQMSPVVACHEALLLPQLLEVCWLVELSSAEQVLPPVVYNNIITLIRFIAVMFV